MLNPESGDGALGPHIRHEIEEEWAAWVTPHVANSARHQGIGRVRRGSAHWASTRRRIDGLLRGVVPVPSFLTLATRFP